MAHYYDSSNLERIGDLVKLAPKAAGAFLSFENEVYHSLSSLPLKTKELIALSVAHVTGCPYCIDVHVKKYKALGGTREEMFEAILVAASTRSGAILSHATHALVAFEAQDSAEAKNKESSGPECFC
jgi:AhpD family alkylhydroperoxidase